MLNNLKENILGAYHSGMDAAEAFGDRALEYEQSVKNKLMDVYTSLHHYSESVDSKVQDFYKEFKHINDTERFRPIIMSIEEMFNVVDAQKYD